MEPSGRNRWQPVANGTRRKPLKQADPQTVATHGNRFAAHGKEGVEGSSPSEGSAKTRLTGFLRAERLALCRACGGYGAVFGAFEHASRPHHRRRGTCHDARSRRAASLPVERAGDRGMSVDGDYQAIPTWCSDQSRKKLSIPT